MLGIGLSLTGRLKSSASILPSFSPSSLFSLSEPGIWLDPSDVANLAWRRNLLTFTEQFDNAVWSKSGSAVTSNVAAAPDGTTTADKITPDTSNSTKRVGLVLTASGTSTWSFSFYAKGDGYSRIGIWDYATSGAYASFLLSGSGSVLDSGVGAAGASISSVGNGWYRCSFRASVTGSVGFGVQVLPDSYTTGSISGAWIGNGTSGILIWGAQLELGSVATDYQRISDVNTEVIERFPSATLYQDPAGTTPVTSPAQTVGLALDKSKGLVLGSELVTNGDFSSGTTGWSIGVTGGTIGSYAVIDGEMRLTTGTNEFLTKISQSFTTIIGKWYEVRGNVRLGTAPNAYVTVGSTGTASSIAVAGGGTGSYVLRFAAIGTTTFVRMDCGGAVGSTAFFDNISVKELPGFHATQATLASRPTYALMPPSGKRNLLNNTDTLATQTLMMTAAQHTLSFRGTGTVTLTGASIAGPLVGTGANNIVSLTFTPTANNLTLTVSGTVNNAQLELGAARTTYQTVTNDGYNVTEAGVTSLPCLSFNGVSNFLITPTITPGIDKAQVFAGVRSNHEAASFGLVAEFGTGPTAQSGFGYDVGTTTGSFSSGQLAARSFVELSSLPSLYVAALAGDRAGTTAPTEIPVARINGTTPTTTYTFNGGSTGNYPALAMFIGRRAGTSLPFRGNIFSLIVRFGTNLDAGTITSTETWVAGKTGVTL